MKELKGNDSLHEEIAQNVFTGKNWIEQVPDYHLNNLDSQKVFIDPDDAISLDEINSIMIEEDVKGTITTVYNRKKED